MQHQLGRRDNEIKIGKSAATVNLELRILRSIFNTARRQELTLTNRAEVIDYLTEDGETRIPFTDDAVKALLAVADVEWRGMILVGYHAGLRLSDAANLTWANIDLVARTLSYAARKTARRKKRRDRTTTICLHADLMDYFTGLQSNDDPTAPVFPNREAEEAQKIADETGLPGLLRLNDQGQIVWTPWPPRDV